MGNLSTISNEEARPEMDNLLHDYFQADLPHPWPTFQAPRPMRMRPTSSFWSRYSGRLALAACIGLLMAGYLTLGGFFPRSQTPTGVQDLQHNMGKGFKDPKRVAPAPSTGQGDDAAPHVLDKGTSGGR